MSNKRRTATDNEHIMLVTEAEGVCPKCQRGLMYEKKASGRTDLYKGYEVAHIYPLNPSPAEASLLAKQARLSDDVNNRRNLIALCESCHKRFDQPRTVEEYEELVSIKKRLLARFEDRQAWGQFRLEEQLREVVQALLSSDGSASAAGITFDAKAVDDKADSTLSALTRFRIKQDVSQYFSTIQLLFNRLQSTSAGSAEQIANEVRIYYLSLQKRGDTQDAIFIAVSEWIRAKTGVIGPAPEVLTSFFVQNCEVFK